MRRWISGKQTWRYEIEPGYWFHIRENGELPIEDIRPARDTQSSEEANPDAD